MKPFVGKPGSDLPTESPAKSNGEHTNGGGVVDQFVEEDVLATEDVGGDVEDLLGEEPPSDGTRLYFVRMPRPPIDDGLVKRLQNDFTLQVAKIKTFNSKLQTKRVSGKTDSRPVMSLPGPSCCYLPGLPLLRLHVAQCVIATLHSHIWPASSVAPHPAS